MGTSTAEEYQKSLNQFSAEIKSVSDLDTQQLRALQIASKVLNRMAFAFPVFKMERLERVKSTFSESSLSDIFRFAIMTSKFTIIGIF